MHEPREAAPPARRPSDEKRKPSSESEAIVRRLLTTVSYRLTFRHDRSFRDKALERFFATGDGRRLSVQNTRRIANILRALDDASRPEDMSLPGFRFHALAGRDKGRYAINASGNWRVTIGWTDGDATDVDLEDYH